MVIPKVNSMTLLVGIEGELGQHGMTLHADTLAMVNDLIDQVNAKEAQGPPQGTSNAQTIVGAIIGACDYTASCMKRGPF